MSKRGKRKQKVRQSQLSVSDIGAFKKKICNSCNLCGNSSKPDFCFSMYTQNAKNFVDISLPVLRGMQSYIKHFSVEDDRELVAEILQEAFCTTGCSDHKKAGDCAYYACCFTELKQQLQDSKRWKKALGKYNSIKQIKKIAKHKKADIQPSFFCNEGFEKIIEEILHGNDPVEQDTTEERAGNVEADFDRATSLTKP